MLTTSIVSTAALTVALREAHDFIRKHVVVTNDQAATVALWVAHTHTIDAFDTTPYLQITSATKRAGKTTLLELLETVVARPWLTGRISAAALVRKVDADRPTLLLDESDATFKGEKEYAEALRGILNSGYKRSGKASICVGKDFTPRDFSTFGPKAIAGIGKLPDTVADRTIPIVLRRKMSSERVARWRARDGHSAGRSICQKVAGWAASGDTLAQLREARPSLPEALSDRAQDVWEPLLSIADLAGGHWPQSARRAAVALMGAAEDDDPTILLLTDLADILCEVDDDVVPTQTILQKLVALEDRPWATWRRDKPITARNLASILSPLLIRPIHLERLRGYERRAFNDAIARYLPDHPSSCQRPAETGIQLPGDVSLGSPGQIVNCEAIASIDSAVADGMTLGTSVSEGGPHDGLF